RPLVEQDVLVLSELATHQPGEPTVNRRRTKVEQARIVRNAIELDGPVRNDPESELSEERSVFLDVAQDAVEAAKVGAEPHVQALEIEVARRVDRRWPLAVVPTQGKVAEEHRFVRRDRRLLE